MKAPAPRGIGVAGEDSDTKSDQRIIDARRLSSQVHPFRPIGEIAHDTIVAVLAKRHDLAKRQAGIVADLHLGRSAT